MNQIIILKSNHHPSSIYHPPPCYRRKFETILPSRRHPQIALSVVFFASVIYLPPFPSSSAYGLFHPSLSSGHRFHPSLLAFWRGGIDVRR